MLDPKLDSGDCVKVAAELIVGCCTVDSELEAEEVGKVETDEGAAEVDAESSTD